MTLVSSRLACQKLSMVPTSRQYARVPGSPTELSSKRCAYTFARDTR